MKKVFKLVGIIVFAAVIVFSMVTCEDTGEDDTPQIDNSSYSDPLLTGSVTITGTAAVGQTLTANITNLDGYGTVTYQWKRGTENIGTDSNTYIVVEADIGLTITVTVTRAGYSGSQTSDPTAVVTTALELTGSVTITGDAIVGKTLRANITSLSGTGTVTYQWKAGTDIVGTDSSTYVVTEADIGKTITVTVTRAGYTGSIDSAPTAAVARPFWTVVENSPFGTDVVQSVAYGNNKFIAVGRSGKMASSADGKTWTALTNTVFGSNIITDIVNFGSSKWVAVGTSGKIAYSSDDGATWTAVTTSTFSAGIISVASNLSYCVAVGTSGKIAYSSDDGVTWTAVTSTFGSDTINSVACSGLGGNSWVAVGASGKMAYCSSSSPTSWTQVTNSTFGTTAINGVAYGGSKYVAVGDYGKIAYSTDRGITWTQVTNSPFGTTAIRNVAWNNGSEGYAGLFVAVGNGGNAATSPDGITWTAVTDGSFGYNDIYDIAFDYGMKPTGVAVGSSGKIAYNIHE